MDTTSGPEMLAMRKTIIEFARTELNPGIEDRDRNATFSRALWNKCAAMRLIALPFPEEFGGDGFDFVTSVMAYQALGYACKDSGLAHALSTQVICGIMILLFGSAEQKQSLLPRLISGEHIYCQGITEPGSGSDAFAMRTTAARDGQDYILNGAKTMITNAPVADRALVLCVTDASRKTLGGISCFLLEKGQPGFTQGKPMEKMGLRTLTNGELVMADCRVPAASLVGGEGQGAILFSEAMEWERTLIPALLLGELERTLEESVRYARERQAFGKPIAEFQAVSHKIATMKMHFELGRLALYHAAALKDKRKRAALDTSVAKLFISESLKQACLDAVQIRGGYGFMTEYEAERDLRNSIAATLYSGTSEMQYNIIARLAGL